MRHQRRIRVCAALVCAALAPLLPTTAPLADETEEDGTSVAQPCINHSRLRRTKVLGDRNIVFVTRDGSIYNNELPRQCPSLTRSSLLNYAVTNGRMCSGDSFQVLWQVGTNYQPTFICQLGMFAPITEDEMSDLEALADAERGERRTRRRSERDMVRTERVELPRTTEPASQAPSQ